MEVVVDSIDQELLVEEDTFVVATVQMEEQADNYIEVEIEVAINQE
jgi:hypothetical protein